MNCMYESTLGNDPTIEEVLLDSMYEEEYSKKMEEEEYEKMYKEEYYESERDYYEGLNKQLKTSRCKG